MQQWGLEITASNKIDDIAYTYFTNSNKLKAVTESGALMNQGGCVPSRAVFPPDLKRR